jgi:tetratricopeptide (TPR) repeat protein
MPFTEPVVLDKEINSAVVTTFSNAITEKDKGNIDKSEELLKIVEEFSADFKYIDDIKAQLEELKKQVKKNTEDIEVLKKSDVLINENIEITTTDPISAGKNFDKLGNFKEAEKYFLIGLNRLTNQQLGEYLNYNNLLYELCFKYKDYDNAIKYSNNILEIYPLFENAVSFKAQSLIKLQKNTEFILWAKNYLEMANLKDDSRKFSECLDIYKIKNKIEGKFNDISYRTYTKGFSINLLDNEFYQGKNEFFGAMLSQFCEENNKLNGLISTLDFLKKINSEQILNKFDLEQPNQYYIPKSQYVTKIAKSNDNFVIVKTGEPLLGNYFEKSDGTLWSGEGPDKCPCLKVLSKEDFLALKNQQIKKDWQKVSFQTEGWYSLLIKNTKNARERFIDCIYYDTKKIRNNNFKISSENIQLLGTLLENEKNQDINSFLINLYATELYKYSEDLINDVINFGHSFLLEKNYEQAIKIYKLTDSNYMLNNYNLSVIQIIKNDLNDFLAKELISNKDLENVIQKINR